MKFSSYALCSAAALALAPTTSAQKMGFGGQIMNQEDFNKFDSVSELERLVALTKNQWPECLHGDANECEALIKSELDSMDLSFPVQTVIIYTRNKNSPTAHAWVVPIDDNGMCIGKHKDGRIFYEYEWCVDEEEPLTDAAAIKESKKLIKPSKWAKIACERKKDLECDYDEPNEPGTGGTSDGDGGDETDNESDNETDTVTTVTEVSEPSDDGSGGGNNGGGNNNNNNGINGDGNPNSSIEINNGNGGSGENNGSQGTGNPNSNGGGNNGGGNNGNDSDNETDTVTTVTEVSEPSDDGSGGGNNGGGNNNNNNGINGDGNPNSSIEINNGNEGSGENNGSQGTGNPNSNGGGNNGQGNSNKDKRRLLSQLEYVSGLKEWRQNILNDVGVGGDFEPVCSTYEGIQKILEVRANGPIVNKGCQRLPAINCSGLSGIDTCKMIKEMIPYPNNKGKNMECFLQYLPNSPKRGEIQRDLAGAGHNTKDKVVIYAVYETNRVIATPQMNGPNSEIGSV